MNNNHNNTKNSKNPAKIAKIIFIILFFPITIPYLIFSKFVKAMPVRLLFMFTWIVILVGGSVFAYLAVTENSNDQFQELTFVGPITEIAEEDKEKFEVIQKKAIDTIEKAVNNEIELELISRNKVDDFTTAQSYVINPEQVKSENTDKIAEKVRLLSSGSSPKVIAYIYTDKSQIENRARLEEIEEENKAIYFKSLIGVYQKDTKENIDQFNYDFGDGNPLAEGAKFINFAQDK